MDKKTVLLLFILLLGGFFRLYGLETIPYWHWDEGVNMNIALSLLEGQPQWFCLKYAFVPHPPLFFLVAAPTLHVFGTSLLVLRGLCAAYGILSILLVYLIGKEMLGEKTGLLSALLYAIYPAAIYWNRMGFANNQVMFLSLLALYMILLFLKRKEDKWLFLSAAFVGLGLVTDILGGAAFLSIAWLLYSYKREKLVLFVLISSVFPLVFLCFMLLYMPEEFLRDILSNSNRSNILALLTFIGILLFASYPSKFKDMIYEFLQRIYSPIFTELKENIPLVYLLASSAFLFLISPPSDQAFLENFDWFWMGFAGFYLVKNRVDRNTLFSFFFAFFGLLLWLDRADHMVIPLYPLLCLGLSALLFRVYDVSLLYFKEKRILRNTLLATILVFHPVAINTGYDVALFVTGDILQEGDIASTYKIAEYTNDRVSPEDVVITNSHLAWMINAKTSVLTQCAAYENKQIAYLRGDYPPERFAFNCSCKNAKFLVLSNDSVEWALNQSALNETIKHVLDWSSEEVEGSRVYRNPYL